MNEEIENLKNEIETLEGELEGLEESFLEHSLSFRKNTFNSDWHEGECRRVEKEIEALKKELHDLEAGE